VCLWVVGRVRARLLFQAQKENGRTMYTNRNKSNLAKRIRLLSFPCLRISVVKLPTSFVVKNLSVPDARKTPVFPMFLHFFHLLFATAGRSARARNKTVPVFTRDFHALFPELLVLRRARSLDSTRPRRHCRLFRRGANRSASGNRGQTAESSAVVCGRPIEPAPGNAGEGRQSCLSSIFRSRSNLSR
jgi:hypothetical protein